MIFSAKMYGNLLHLRYCSLELAWLWIPEDLWLKSFFNILFNHSLHQVSFFIAWTLNVDTLIIFIVLLAHPLFLINFLSLIHYSYIWLFMIFWNQFVVAFILFLNEPYSPWSSFYYPNGSKEWSYILEDQGYFLLYKPFQKSINNIIKSYEKN